jgi:type IV pilus assembly protein PilO
MPVTAEDFKRMPNKYKVILLLFVLLLIGYFYYFFFFQAILDSKGKLEERLGNLQKQIQAKELVAGQIKKHKKELAELRENLVLALARLPEQKEIPGLLTSVSQAGIKTGLQFLLFQPASPVSKDFYAEIPVKIAIVGSYCDIAHFFVSVADLPRIVNIKNISIQRGKSAAEDKKNLLTVNCFIKTYMFLEKKHEGKKNKRR